MGGRWEWRVFIHSQEDAHRLWAGIRGGTLPPAFQQRECEDSDSTQVYGDVDDRTDVYVDAGPALGIKFRDASSHAAKGTVLEAKFRLVRKKRGAERWTKKCFTIGHPVNVGATQSISSKVLNDIQEWIQEQAANEQSKVARTECDLALQGLGSLHADEPLPLLAVNKRVHKEKDHAVTKEFTMVQHRLESEGRASPSFWTVALETKKDVGEIYRLLEQALPADALETLPAVTLMAANSLLDDTEPLGRLAVGYPAFVSHVVTSLSEEVFTRARIALSNEEQTVGANVVV